MLKITDRQSIFYDNFLVLVRVSDYLVEFILFIFVV